MQGQLKIKDDAIARLIAEMRIAAKEDRDLNEHGKPAIKKIGMLRHVMHNLAKVGVFYNKTDIYTSFKSG